MVRRAVELVASPPPGLAQAAVENPGASLRGEREHTFGLCVGNGRLALEAEDRADAVELLTDHRAERQAGRRLVVQADHRRAVTAHDGVSEGGDPVGYRRKRD